jgi:hypothetical protein
MSDLEIRHHGPSVPVVPGYPPLTIMKGSAMYSTPNVRNAEYPPYRTRYGLPVAENPAPARHSRWPWFVGLLLVVLGGFGAFVIIAAIGSSPAPAPAPGFTTMPVAPLPQTQDRVKAVQSAHPL